jgi:hypothetical protein
MRAICTATIVALSFLAPTTGQATGLATCDSGPQTGWKSQEALADILLKVGWKEVRRMKPDGGCWEVYGINENGRQAESYFHPVTLQHIMTTQR